MTRHWIPTALALLLAPAWASAENYTHKFGQLSEGGITVSFDLVLDVPAGVNTTTVASCTLKATFLRRDTAYNAGKVEYSLIKNQNRKKTEIKSGTFVAIDLKDGKAEVKQESIAGRCEEIDDIEASFQAQVVKKLQI